MFIFRFVQNGLSFFSALAVWLFSQWLWALPNRIPAPPEAVAFTVEHADLHAALPAPLSLAGAWRLVPDGADMAGWSAAAIDGDGKLLILSDEGRFAKLDVGALKSGPLPLAIRDLAHGPGPATRKQNRDSEALSGDGQGGWLVAFEQYDQVWRYDASLAKGRMIADLGNLPLTSNGGIEGMVRLDDGRLLLFPEAGGQFAMVEGARVAMTDAPSIPPGVSDVARLPSGELLVLSRGLGLRLLENRLTLLDAEMKPRAHWRLPVGPFDNMEGLAVERKEPGRARLWLISDNNGRGYVRTLIVAIDLDLEAAASLRPPQP